MLSFQPRPVVQSGLFSALFLMKTLLAFLLYVLQASYSYSPGFDHSNGEEYKHWNSLLWNCLHTPVTSSHLGSNIPLSSQLLDMVNMYFSCDMRNQVS
jgi:hypothetical protein